MPTMQLRASWIPRRSLAIARGVLPLATAALASIGCALNMPNQQTASTTAKPDAATPSATGSTNAPTGRPKTRVALLLPVSAQGRLSAIATAMKQAGELAVFESNSPHVQLIIKDTRGTPEGAQAAVSAAIQQGASLILGPLTSVGTKAAAPVARSAQIPVISFSNDATAAGSGVYLLSFLVQQEVDRIITYAAAQGHRRFVGLIPRDSYGNITEQAFRGAVHRVGGTIAAVEHYNASAARVMEPTQRLTETIKLSETSGQPIDAVFLPGGLATLPNLGPLLNHIKTDNTRIRLLGTGGWDQAQLGQQKAFVGGWFAAPAPAGWKSFTARYVEAYGMSPPRIATLAHDAVTIAVGLASGPARPPYSTATITNPRGFTGLDGPFRFQANGLSVRRLAILEVTPNGAHMIDPPQPQVQAKTGSNHPLSFNMN